MLTLLVGLGVTLVVSTFVKVVPASASGASQNPIDNCMGNFNAEMAKVEAVRDDLSKLANGFTAPGTDGSGHFDPHHPADPKYWFTKLYLFVTYREIATIKQYQYPAFTAHFIPFFYHLYSKPLQQYLQSNGKDTGGISDLWLKNFQYNPPGQVLPTQQIEVALNAIVTGATAHIQGDLSEALYQAFKDYVKTYCPDNPPDFEVFKSDFFGDIGINVFRLAKGDMLNDLSRVVGILPPYVNMYLLGEGEAQLTQNLGLGIGLTIDQVKQWRVDAWNKAANRLHKPIAVIKDIVNTHVSPDTIVDLDGSASYDPNGPNGNNLVNTLTYSWQVLDPLQFKIPLIPNNRIDKPFFFAPQVSSPTTLTVQLVVNNGIFNSQPTTIQITIDPTLKAQNGAQTFIVNTNVQDNEPCTPSHCSLPEAITEANANPGTDTIDFNLPPNQLTLGVVNLPEITDPVIIDGTSQPGYIDKPIVELNGGDSCNTAGLVISAGNSKVKGLVIDNCPYGIILKGSQKKTQTDSNTYSYSTTVTGGNVIEGNYIGSGMGSSTGNGIGVEIEASNKNKIGGLTPSERNIISGNTIAGIRVIDGVKTQVVQFNTPSDGQFTVSDTPCDIQCASSSNWIEGNYIGTDSTGKNAVPNGLYGVAILRSHDNIIGGTGQNARNIISGNGKDGIIISGDISTNNVVEGNYIGVDVDGTNKLPNTEMGVRLTSIIPQTASGVWQTSSGSTTYLGTPALNNIGNAAQHGAQNVISGNGQDGVYIGENALVNQVDGNFIGTDPTGKNAVGNSQNGVAIVGAVGNFIGGLNTDTPLSSIASYDSQNKIYTLNLLAGSFGHGQVHNIISGNGQNGVYINLDSIERDQNGNPVKDSNGNDIKKYVFAIFPSSTSSITTVGSSGTATVYVANNFVRGNYIGTDTSGTSDLGNTADGVAIVDSSKNMVTTPTTSDPTPSIADPNIISFNKGNGVSVISTTPGSATSNNIVGNDILNNGKLGIDLGNDGVTQNHDISNGVDSGVGGPNDFMNYPSCIVFYNSKYNQTVISGSLNATNPSSAQIEVYANKKANPSGHGEGGRLLGYITPNGTGSFIAALGKGNILNSTYNDNFGSKFNDDNSEGNLFPVITATATKNNSTSEFSAEFRHVIPPIANAGHYQRVAEGQTVTLNGTNSTVPQSQPGDKIVSYSWQQSGGGGPPVRLIAANTAISTFVAPNVTAPTVLYFRLTVTDSNGATDSDTVPILVTKASQTPEYCSDNDNDWICNEVDTKPNSFSNDFSDFSLGGTTNGTVADRGSQLFTIREQPNPDGVRITDLSQDPGLNDISNIIRNPQPANIIGCGGAIQFYLNPGDGVILTCGSADLQALSSNDSQPISITYHTKDGITASAFIDSGNKLIFDPISTSITASSNNSHAIAISTQNRFFLLQPGETEYLSHLPIVNTSILSAKDARGQLIMNGSSTNSSSIVFNFKGNTTVPKASILDFECLLDNKNHTLQISSSVSMLSYCTPPYGYTNLPSDTYTFHVAALDTNFNLGPFANFTWTVDNNSSNATAGPLPIAIDPLVANAGSNQTVNQGQKVILQGNNSSSSTNNLTSDNQRLFPDYKVIYLWRQLAGPAVELNGTDTTNPSFIAPTLNNTNSNTTLSFELTVSDSIGQVASDRVSILVNATGNNTNNNGNNPHHIRAIAGPDQTISASSDTLFLTANGTVDSPFHIVSYEWSQVGGPSLALFNKKSNDFIYTRDETARLYTGYSLDTLQPFNGSPTTTSINDFPILDNNTKFTFKLTVVDNTGLNASSIVNVNYVVSKNTHHLLANGGPDQTISANMSNPKLSFFNRFNLDDYGSSVDNSPPPTQISRSQWLQIGGPPISFSDDSYACAGCFFGQGDTPVGVTPPILDNISSNTKFTFKYSVADDQGEVSSVIKNVYYNITKNTHHLVASAKNTLKYVSEDLGSIPLNANASTVDPPANIVGYQWNQLAGPEVHASSSSLSTAGLGLAKSLNVISLSDSPITEVFTDQPLSSFANNTKFTFKLTVVDNQGEVSSDTVDVHLVKSSTITANAGPDRVVVNEGQPVTLNGTYNDPAVAAGAHIVLTDWYLIVDNSSSSIRIPKVHDLYGTGLVSTTPTLNFTAPFVQNDTTLKFRFFVEDSAGRSANSNVISVLVKNNASRIIDPPIADAGTYKNAFTEGSIVHLNGTNSYDPQNRSLTYSWKQLTSQSRMLPSYYHLNLQNANTSTPSFVVPYLPTNASDYTITTTDGHILSYVIFNIQLKVTNAAGNSSTDTARIDVLNTNHSPTVLSSGRVFSTDSRNAFANVQLEGSDPDKDALSFFVLQGPKHGTLHMIDGSNITTTTSPSGSSSIAPTKITSAFNVSSISIAKIVYTPNKNYTGLDSFTYKANDGILDSNNNGTAIINADDHAPSIPVTNQIINTVSYRETNITLNAKDLDSSDALTYSILSNPSHGSIIKFDPHTGSLQYRPFGKYSSADNFTFKTNDGLLDSSIGTVTLHINASTTPFSKGDIIVAVGGQLRWYKSDGTFSGHYLFPAVPSKFTTDIAFDPSGSYMYAVQNDSKTITKFDKFGNSLGAFGSGWANQSGPNSLAVDKQGNIYVGLSFVPISSGSPLFMKFDPNGNLLKIYKIPSGTTNSNTVYVHLWIDLAPDDCTLYYSDTGGVISRWDVCTDTQLENFGGNDRGETTVGGTGEVSFGAHFGVGAGPLRVLPNGTALMFSIPKGPVNGTLSSLITPINSTAASVTYTPKVNFTGTDSFTYKANDEETVLLNQGSHIDRVNYTLIDYHGCFTGPNLQNTNQCFNSYKGNVIQKYQSNSPNNSWFTINLDPNCKSSFWAADVNNGIYKFDIPTGKLLQHINIQSPLQGFAVEKGNQGCNNASTNMTTSHLSPTIVTSQNKPVNITLNGIINGNNNSTVANLNPITVKIDVNPFQNHPPVAVNAKASTNEDTPVNINVLVNATNPDHNLLSVTAIPAPPKNGTAVINTNNNTITYTPSPYYFGVDSFAYTISDGQGDTSTANVFVTVKHLIVQPVANAGENQTVNENTTGVTLNGSKSYDRDGRIVSYLWSQIDGPHIALSNSSAAITTFTALSVINDTNLRFKLTVTDNDNATSSATTNVLVKNVNLAPIANAGPDQKVNENTTNVTLNGTGSSDPDKNDTIASYSWKQVSGTPIVTLTGANTATPSFTAPSVTADTTLKFNLTVTDNHGATSKPDSVSITIKNINIPPVANAGTNQTVNENTTGITLDGSKSFDKDGNITSYDWQQTAGPLVNLSDIHSIRPIFTAPPVTNDTLLRFKLTVADNDNATSSASTNVLVKYVNILPIANAGTNQTVFDNASGPITLDGTKSHDPDGTIKSYHWTEISGSGSDSRTVQLTGANTSKASFNMPHLTRDTTLTFELTVTDNQGANSTADTSVLIRHVNLPPIAAAGPSQIVNESKTVTLNGTKSSDPDGTIHSYIWIQTAGPKINLTSSNTATPSFVAPRVLADTTLTFNLKVTDNQGEYSTNPTSTIIIVKHVNVPPIADAGTNQTVNGNTTVTLDGTKSRDSDGGNISSYQWIQTSGPIVTLTGANAAKATFTAPTSTISDTTLTFRLTVKDSDGGASSSATTSVLVKRTNVPPVANAGANQTVIENTTGVILDGSKSIDPDGGKIASYQWTQTAGPTVKLNESNTITPTFTAPSVKVDTTLTFKLTVNDSDGGASSSATTNVLVKHVNIPPTAIITPANQTVNENTTNVVLDGSASSDKDGTITSYSWTQTSGPSVSLTGGNTSKATFTAPSVAKDTALTFKLVVTDNDNATSSTTSNVLVKNVNIPPVANAGENQTVNENTTGVTLSASKSYDPDGRIVSYLWTQTSGPSVVLTSPNSATTTFTAPSVTKDTSLTFRLTVKDDGGAESSATTTVLVKNVNLSPIANAGANQTVNENTTGVKLDGTKSFDRDGTIASYSWVQTAGPTVTLTGATTATPTFTAPSVTKDTTLTFKLTVTDNDGASSSLTTNVLVKNVNISPVANAGTNQTVNENTTGVKLDGSKSFDKDGTITSYMWQQIAGPTVTLSSPNSASTTFTAPSVTADTTLSFKLTVTDDNGASSSATTSVLVKNVIINVNHPPVANAGADQTVNEGTANVKLDGTKSYDPDKGDTIASYSWTQTAGPIVTLANAKTATPTFTAPQVNADTTLTFSLKVTDNHGAASTNIATTSVLVKNVNQHPIAKATVSPSSTVNGGTVVTLDGSGSNDPDGMITSYQWVQTAGSPTITLQGANLAKATFTAPSNLAADTTYTFKLTVTDNAGAFSSATISVLVKHVNQPPIAVIAGGNTGQTVNSSQTVTLDGGKSYDPDGGKISSYLWTQTSGQTVTLTGANTDVASFKAPVVNKDTTLSFKLTVTDNDGGASSSTTTNIIVKQSAPVCSTATPSTFVIWPPDHKFVSITIQNVKDPDGDPVTTTITKIMQDEPVNSAGSGNTSPDGSGVGTSTAHVRAEREGNGDGRVYPIYFTASDGKAASDSGTCNGQILVSVPHDQAHPAIDEGPLYDSTVMPSGNNINKPNTALATGTPTKNTTTTAISPNSKSAGVSPSGSSGNTTIFNPALPGISSPTQGGEVGKPTANVSSSSTAGTSSTSHASPSAAPTTSPSLSTSPQVSSSTPTPSTTQATPKANTAASTVSPTTSNNNNNNNNNNNKNNNKNNNNNNNNNSPSTTSSSAQPQIQPQQTPSNPAPYLNQQNQYPNSEQPRSPYASPLTSPSSTPQSQSTTSPISPSPYPYESQPLQQQQQQLHQPQIQQPPSSGIQRVNQPPTANAGLSQTVYGGSVVLLDGRNSYDPDSYAVGIRSDGARIITNNGIAAYQWTQVQIPTTSSTTPAVQSPVVMLQGANTGTPTFVASVLPYDTMLAFSLKVMDSDGGSVSTNPAIVYVMIKHNPNNIGTTGGNTPGTIIIQPQQQQQQQQQQQPIVPNNNAPSQPNSPPTSSPPQIGSPHPQNTVPSPGVP